MFGCDGDYYVWKKEGTSWRVSHDFNKCIGYPNLDTSEIRYTQNSISQYFPNFDNYSVYDLDEDLRDGQVDIEDIPYIRVVEDEDGYYWSLDNRRLWAFKEAGLDDVPVVMVQPDGEYKRKRRTVCDGWDIKVRG